MPGMKIGLVARAGLRQVKSFRGEKARRWRACARSCGASGVAVVADHLGGSGATREIDWDLAPARLETAKMTGVRALAARDGLKAAAAGMNAALASAKRRSGQHAFPFSRTTMEP
jgi:hypothetical protein